jgi:hypothetical protein
VHLPDGGHYVTGFAKEPGGPAGERAEAVVLVEVAGGLVDRVDDDEAPARDRDGGGGPLEGVEQPGRAETPTVEAEVQRQAGEQDRGDRPGGSPGQSSSRRTSWGQRPK